VGEVHAQLVRRASKWLIRQRCTFALLEPYAEGCEKPDAIGWQLCGRSILVECKASRADFLADRHKDCRKIPWEFGLGQQRWYATASGVLRSADELPPRWGWLELVGDRFRMRRAAEHAPEIDLEILRREFQVLMPALRKAHRGSGNAPWLLFYEPKPPISEPLADPPGW